MHVFSNKEIDFLLILYTLNSVYHGLELSLRHLRSQTEDTASINSISNKL